MIQDAYVRAYEHLDQFTGKAAFPTWLTRIAIHEALARRRRGRRVEELDSGSDNRPDAHTVWKIRLGCPSPERPSRQRKKNPPLRHEN